MSLGRYVWQKWIRFSCSLQLVKNGAHSTAISSFLLVQTKYHQLLYSMQSKCSLCSKISHALIHMSPTSTKKRKSKDEKAAVSLNPKPMKTTKKSDKVIPVWKNMTVQELADVMGKDLETLFEIFLYVPNSNSYDSPKKEIEDMKVAQEAVKKAGMRFKIENPQSNISINKEFNDAVKRAPASKNELALRPPVVTIMGHVDHGKTTLLDALRNTSVVDTEFGGITQHIGAFSVKLETGERVTFLDTPGHAAFSAMRARGATLTDIVVLVVAADDGVMQQTKESIHHALEAHVPIIVAINKIDKLGANVDRTKKMLLDCGLQLEEQGGEIQCVEISALKGLNLDMLIEALATQAELLNLRSDPEGFVEAIVVEARTDTGRGKVSTCIVQRGTLRKGAILVAGEAWAKVRNMFDDTGKPIPIAPPSTPVQVIGWRELPSAGDDVIEVESEKRAADVVDWRKKQEQLKKEIVNLDAIKLKSSEHLQVYKTQLEERRRLGIRYKRRSKLPREKENVDLDTGPQVSVVLKGDVDGSLEAILDVLDTYHSNDCKLDIISYSVGNVTENDVNIAAAFKGTIYTFNTKVPVELSKLAVSLNVAIKENNIIYRLVENLQDEISSKLPPKDVEEVLGVANVLAEFTVTEGKKKISVAGCRCTKGVLKKNGMYRIIRGQDTIYPGKLTSMRHVKSEVDTINKEKECGLMFEDPDLHFQSGDTIICYQINKTKQVTDWDPGF